jgi:NAD dependent epimerase/dehydratase family enzyme
MARVLVAGGSGFIGRALVRALIARGDRVTVLTRAEAGMREGVPHQRWDPSPGVSAVFSEVYDAVVNLSGEQAVGVRYSERV